MTEQTNYSVIGTRPIRHDGLDKVTGRAIYGADVRIPGQMWAEVVRSPHAHAVIENIDATQALALPGVFAFITGTDLAEAITSEASKEIRWQADNIMATDTARYRGHAVAAIAAIDRNTAIEAAKLVRVSYKPLPPILSVNQAISEEATLIHPSAEFTDLGEPAQKTNIASHIKLAIGNSKAGFEQASLIVERTAHLEMVHQGYIEPHNATVNWDQDDRVSVWSSTQGMFGIRDQLAKLLDLPESNITVNPVEIGGGFGGKTTVYLPPIAALLSKQARRPVKMVMDRADVFQGTGPAPGGEVKVRMGVNDEGKLVAAEAKISLEAGAYPGSNVDLPTAWCFSTYNIPNVTADGYDVLVNKPKSNAFRAPGQPQAAFCVEQVVDEICEQKGWDPLQFRIDNAATEGTRRTDAVPMFSIGLEQVLNTAQKSDHWLSEKPASSGKTLRGRGIAVGFSPHMGGPSSVRISLNRDGTISLSEGSQDIGGTRVALAMIAAEALSIPVESVHPSIPSTNDIGYTYATAGSRVINATGQAVWEAAHALIEKAKSQAADVLETPKDQISFSEGLFKGTSDQTLSLADIARLLDETEDSLEVSGQANPTAPTNGFAVHICDLEIDGGTGKTEITRYTTIQDVGTAVHPAYVEGQMQGGAAQGIGWTLNEEYKFDDEGTMLNSSFLDYRMPTTIDMPMIDTILVEVPNPLHPVGVRGVAETPIVPPLGTVANAVHDATKIRFYQHPINPQKILSALQHKAE
ncbi:MAG: xanthine dehydrogenase family protein molybdopterin-binding subunit [Chloroflexi bacterium]|nr:xanthine dehydrogenase family protein molybdopterin-binding subunit [Chloroflexota bacterium]